MATLSEPLPVYLLTGFLGSGKTTLLSRLVHDAAFADTAVIINEFGAIGLDHVLLQKSDDSDVVLLDSGCLCCASNSPLQDSLESLYYQRLRESVPAFSRVVVETSGLADPLPLINALGADPSVARHYRFAGVVTVLDALNGLNNLRQFRESALQLAVADKVILSKTDIATAEQVAAVRDAARAARPDVPIVVGADEPPMRFLDGLQGHARSAVESQASAPSAGPFTHLARYGIGTHTLRFQGALPWPLYARLVELLQQRLGERLLRAKGVLALGSEGEVETSAVHGVRHLFATPRPIDMPASAAQVGALVLITMDADIAEVQGIADAAGAHLLPALRAVSG